MFPVKPNQVSETRNKRTNTIHVSGASLKKFWGRSIATSLQHFLARGMTASASGLKSGLLIPIIWGLPHDALASAFDMRPGVTEMSMRIQALHHMALWVCVVVGVVVFGAMFYSIIAHRRSRNPTLRSSRTARLLNSSGHSFRS